MPSDAAILNLQSWNYHSRSNKPESIMMEELLRTHDPVIISKVVFLLEENNISYLLSDQNMNSLYAGIPMIYQRIMVDAEQLETARSILRQEQLGDELSEK